MASNRSWANVLGRPSSPGNENDPPAYVVNRRNSSGTDVSPRRLNSIVTIQEPIHESLAPRRPSLHRPHGSSATLGSLQRQIPDSRRPSIAQVLLSKVPSRTSFISQVPSRSSYVSEGPSAAVDEDVVLSKSQRRKRRRGKQQRRKSSASRDHGDFIASRVRPPEMTSTSIKPLDRTPLIIAISEGDVEKVQTLIADKANLPVANDPNNRPLQAAALAGNETIIKLLLQTKSFDVNARDSRERTAVYAATSRGHDSIVKLLVDNHKAKRLSAQEAKYATQEFKQWKAFQKQIDPDDRRPIQREPTLEGAEITTEPEHESDGEGPSMLARTSSRGESIEELHLYKLQLGSSANMIEAEEETNQKRQDLQKRGEWVMGPTPLSVPGKEALIPRKHPRYPGLGFHAPVVEFDFTSTPTDTGGHRIMTPTVDDLLYGTKGIDSIIKGKAPTSNQTCRWYHLPANHLGWAEDLIRKIYENSSQEEQKKRDVILRREPFGSDRDHTDPTALDPSPQARALRPICRNMTLDRDGTQRLSTALALVIPYAHWETEENRAEMHHVMKEVREARKSDIDCEDPSKKSIPDLKTIQDHPAWNKNEKLLCAYLYNNPPVHPRRTLDQFYYHMLENTEQRDQDQVIGRYYHNVFERHRSPPKDNEDTNSTTQGKTEPRHHFVLPRPQIVEDLEKDNAPTQNPQNSTPAIANGRSQTPLNPTNQCVKQNKADQVDEIEKRHVIMVDQLWLLILDQHTIITSFPPNWTDGDSNTNDEMDVLQSIYRYLALVNRYPLESVRDLARLIVNKCLATFCKKATPYGDMQILDVYESAIASVTDQESKIFNKFAIESKERESKDRDSRDPRTKEELYNIDEEIKQLKEIKDIQDELHILSVLLENQISVLDQAAKALKALPDAGDALKSPASVGSSDSKDTQGPQNSSEQQFHTLYDMVKEQEKRRKSLQDQAEQANKALNHLLDLKQKQANVSEARSARLTAESAKQQGNIMVLFTLVTIIFAPLSLMSTIFSLRIVEFPDVMHMKYVLKYMFVVSICVIIPLLGLVIYTTRRAIAKLWWRIVTRMEREKEVEREEEEREGLLSVVDGGEVKEGLEVMEVGDGVGEKRRKRARFSLWRKKSKLNVEDQEKGELGEGMNGVG